MNPSQPEERRLGHRVLVIGETQRRNEYPELVETTGTLADALDLLAHDADWTLVVVNTKPIELEPLQRIVDHLLAATVVFLLIDDVEGAGPQYNQRLNTFVPHGMPLIWRTGWTAFPARIPEVLADIEQQTRVPEPVRLRLRQERYGAGAGWLWPDSSPSTA